MVYIWDKYDQNPSKGSPDIALTRCTDGRTDNPKTMPPGPSVRRHKNDSGEQAWDKTICSKIKDNILNSFLSYFSHWKVVCGV